MARPAVPAAHPKAPAPHRRRWQIFAGLVAVAALLAGLFWLRTRHEESTDDAFIDARIVPVSARVRGHVLHIAAQDNQRVRAGDLLVELDPADYQVRRDEAKAELDAARAEAKRARLDAERYRQLLAKEETSQQTYDRAVADAAVDDARADLAAQHVAEAERNLSYLRIVAPVAGHVTRRMVEVSAFVEEGQPLMAVVPDQVYVTANFKETQLARIRPGQKARLTVDALGGRAFRGHVDSLQDGTGARFSLFPPENASGNFIKVVQRVPVKIVLDEAPPDGALIAPGLSVVATVTVN